MAESRDAYARLPFEPERAQRALDTGGGLTFFDVADWATNEGQVSISPVRIGGFRVVDGFEYVHPRSRRCG